MLEKKLCNKSEIPNKGVKTFNFDSYNIAVFNIDGEFYAIDRKCTHLKGNLAKGLLEGKTITCPLHGSIFDLKTGELLKTPATLAGWFKKASNTKVYPIIVKNNDLYIKLMSK